MTLKEIAAQAGVSVSTVSRVVNSRDDSFASEEVRDRIWEIVRQTGYLPNRSARNLKQGKDENTICGGTLCCVLGHDITKNDRSNLAILSRVIEQQSVTYRYPVRFSYSVFNLNAKLMANTTKEKMMSFNPDGVIAIGRFDENSIDFLKQHYRNVVYVGRRKIHSDWDQIICHSYEAAEIAFNHLYSYGHRRIGYFGAAGDEPSYQAYRNNIEKYNLDFGEGLIYSGKNRVITEKSFKKKY